MEKQMFTRYVDSIVGSLALVAVLVGLVGGASLGAETPAPSAPIAVPVSQSSTPSRDAEDGENLWVEYYCYSCHGWSGNGASALRVSNTPRTLESFIRYVRKPARMPPYVNRVMSDEQLTDVYAFLLSVPPSPDAESIPMLRDLLESR